MINVSFTPKVGVAPGTTTIALDGALTGHLRCANHAPGMGGITLGATDVGPCLPEAPDMHMTWPKEVGAAPAPTGHGVPTATVTASVPYGTDSEMRGLGIHLIDRRQGQLQGHLRGHLGDHMVDYRQGNMGAHAIESRQGMRKTFHARGTGLLNGMGLRGAPFGLSWKSFGTILAVAIGGGVGLAYLAERPTAHASHPTAAMAGARRRRR